MNTHGVVQFYFKEGKDGDFNPCGIPFNLNLSGSNPKVGAIADSELNGEEEMQANEKAMRNRGYMKAPDAYKDLRDGTDRYRIIMTTNYMYSNKDYYFRVRLVTDNPTAVCPFSIIEVVPKNVYLGEIPEDRH